jgi:hypothetical protein
VEGEPVNWVDPSGLTVWICHVLAENSYLRFFRWDHHWVKTDRKEAGVSGTFEDTSVFDHSAPGYYSEAEKKQIVCEEQINANEQCVDSAIVLGEKHGQWGVFNNCITYAYGIVRKCSSFSGNPTSPGAPALPRKVRRSQL